MKNALTSHSSPMTLFFFSLLLVWWMVFFIILPIGIHIPSHQKKGHASSAPSNPRLWQKALITTIISIIITGVAFWLIQNGYVDISFLRSLT